METKEKKSPDLLLFLCYIPLLFIFAKFSLNKFDENNKKNLTLHINQGIIITLLGFVLFILDNLNAFIIVNFFSIFIIIGYIIAVLWILWLSLIVKGMINTVKGIHKPLPLVGKFFNFEKGL